jgi:hypothetical protein
MAMVDTGLPTEPSLRTASSPSSTQVMGDISVWPNTATFSVSGNTSAIRRSNVSEAGAAPQHVTRSAARSRRETLGSEQTACHCVGTRNTVVAAVTARTGERTGSEAGPTHGGRYGGPAGGSVVRSTIRCSNGMAWATMSCSC